MSVDYLVRSARCRVVPPASHATAGEVLANMNGHVPPAHPGTCAAVTSGGTATACTPRTSAARGGFEARHLGISVGRPVLRAAASTGRVGDAQSAPGP